MPQERSAGLVLFRREENAFLFLLLNYGWGHWGFPKGHIEAGETEKEAAIREVEEETGFNSFRFIDKFEERIEYVYRKKGEKVHKEVLYFLAKTEEGTVRLSYEHQGYKWLDFSRALHQLTYDNDKKILTKAKQMIEKSKHSRPE
jgi:8-oxo-dGTP pyrophosphatase MutT (NUDIX family)